jgi:hypothetical protein
MNSADEQAPGLLSLGAFRSSSLGATSEIINNTAAVVHSYAKTTMVPGYTDSSVVNPVGDMLATIVGFFIAAYAPIWVTVVILSVIFLLPRDAPWLSLG